jgi:RNA polymerase sigma-70 factor (ECF subfamily)
MIADLIDAARSGKPQDADALIEAVWPHAFRIAMSIVRERTAAEDAAQEACARAYLAIPQLRYTEAFGVWFYRIVVREANAVRRRMPATSELEDVQPGGREIDASVARVDVRNALHRLSRAQRTVVVLHYYAGLNSREIASVMRIPDSSVRFHLMRAKRALEKMLGAGPCGVDELRLSEAIAGAV